MVLSSTISDLEAFLIDFAILKETHAPTKGPSIVFPLSEKQSAQQSTSQATNPVQYFNLLEEIAKLTNFDPNEPL